MSFRRLFIVVLSLCATVGAAQAQAPVKVVASFSILGDLVREIGGDDVDVKTLVGPNGDAHVFSPAPADAKAVKDAQLVFVNGLGLEGWLDRLAQAAGGAARTVTVSEGVKPLQGKGEHALDPHAWQDVANVRLYIANIRDALAAADPAHKADYTARAEAYLAKLDALDADIRATIAAIPAEKRRVITSHDAFSYFGHAYGLAFIAPQGVSTETDASAGDVATIIRQIRAEKIPAVFLENVSDPRLMERIATETGAKIGEKVYSDALSPLGGPAATYLDMMRHNFHAFAQALGS